MRSRLALALTLTITAPLEAQRAPADVVRDARVRAALERIRTDNAWTIEQQVSLCEIPAPPFKEQARGVAVRDRLRALGLEARVDSVGNVIAVRAGTGAGPVVVLSAHLDTVFPEGTDVHDTRTGTRLAGPGIGDDCRGLAVLLAVARAYQSAGVRTAGAVAFVATVGEEGAGNLRGVRRLMADGIGGRKIDYFLSVDGTGLGITSGAVGSHRYRVHFRGPGGHSYGDFGMPNPIHAMGRAIAAIADLQVPTSPRTTFSVGVVSGGTSVNSIPMEGVMDVDMRSESAVALDSVDAAIQGAITRAVAAEQARWPTSPVRLTVAIDTIGQRPAGAQPADAPIVRAAQAAAAALGLPVPRPGASSTDANIAISMGVPALTIDGGGRGDGEHSTGEWYDDGADGWKGPQWAAVLVASLAGRG